MNANEIRQKFEGLRQAGLDGDDHAARRLVDTCGAGLVRFVRRVLRRGQGRGFLADFVLREASQVRSSCMTLDRDELVDEIVERICSLVVGQEFSHRVDTAQVSLERTVVA